MIELEKKIVYKYMTYKHAIDLIENGNLWFANPKTWKDPFEHIVVETKYMDDSAEYEYPYKNSLGISCFTRTFASEAQWIVYQHWHGSDDIIVQLSFDYQKLLESMSKVNQPIFRGDIYYHSLSETFSQIRKAQEKSDFMKAFNEFYEDKKPLSESEVSALLRPFLYKYNAYEYEQELRFFAINSQHSGSNNGFCLSLPSLQEAVYDMRISPFFTKEDMQARCAIKDKLKFLETGYIDVSNSSNTARKIPVHVPRIYQEASDKGNVQIGIID